MKQTGLSGQKKDKFAQNSAIETFDEFEKFTGMTTTPNTNSSAAPFYGCTNLKSIKLPESLQQIGHSCFLSCTSLQQINLNNNSSIKRIDTYGFEGNSSLKIEGLNLPNLETIGSRAFYGCSLLTGEVNFPTLTTVYGDLCFYGTNITSFKADILENLTANEMFKNIKSLIAVDLPSLKTIENNIFFNCTNLGTVNMPLVETIGSSAFYRCASLANVDLPSLRILKGGNIFRESGVVNFNAPLLTNAGTASFNGCKSLVTITLAMVEIVGDSCFTGCSSLNINMSLPNLKVIEYGGFNATSSLKGRVNLPNLETISGGAFGGSGIEYVDNLGGITSIGYHSWWGGAFSNCTSLKEVTLPSALTTIGGYAFYKCTSLYSINGSSIVNLPNVIDYGVHCFQDCDALTDCYISQNTESLGVINRSAKWKYSSDGIINLPNLKILGNYVFQESLITRVESLGQIECIGTAVGTYSYTFSWSAAEFCRVPSTCAMLATRTFYNADSMVSIIFESTVPPETGVECFYGMDSLVGIYVPDESVEAYKTATNWGDVADKILPLSSYIEN